MTDPNATWLLGVAEARLGHTASAERLLAARERYHRVENKQMAPAMWVEDAEILIALGRWKDALALFPDSAMKAALVEAVDFAIGRSS